jgi:hypothetical protein
LELVKLPSDDFPDPINRKKRELEELPVAPKAEPAPPSKSDMKDLKKKDHQLLNALKIQLQPIMDQINRKYKKFRQPVIAQAQIDYLFAESDPNYVRPDIAEGEYRPFEIVKDKHGIDVLRDTATGRTYYNLETTTIEERLSNGYYARPKDFLFDIRAMAKDAKNIGDKERTLKANELLSNVEVDVASIENSTANIDWDGVYARQAQRTKDAAEKERQKKAAATNLALDRVQSDIGGGNESDSQGPVTLGEAVPGSLSAARFQLRSPLSGEHGTSGSGSHPLSNGTTVPPKDDDVQMSGVEGDTQPGPNVSNMGPPPSKSPGTGMTQLSQRSAVTALPPGVDPSAVANDASTTKTSSLSTKPTGSEWGTPKTNGDKPAAENNEPEIPDTLNRASQAPSSQGQWPHSQAQGIARGELGPGASSSPNAPSSGSQANHTSQESRLNNTPSQPLELDHLLSSLLREIVDATADCSIEQLEQINREMMDELWRTRGEWNRTNAYLSVKTVFEGVMDDIMAMQKGAVVDSP